MHVVTLSGSPSERSRTGALLTRVGTILEQHGHTVEPLALRTLPAEALLFARTDDPALKTAIETIARAQGIVLATPVYKASFSGFLKVFLDVLPQYGLTDKVVFPLATGGSYAHVLALDYALRPVLSSMAPRQVTTSFFAVDKMLTVSEAGTVELSAELQPRFDAAVEEFVRALRVQFP